MLICVRFSKTSTRVTGPERKPCIVRRPDVLFALDYAATSFRQWAVCSRLTLIRFADLDLLAT